MISLVLIAFVSISLVVSSIMIGIITYISVLERKKEIGILRAIGASKRNVANVQCRDLHRVQPPRPSTPPSRPSAASSPQPQKRDNLRLGTVPKLRWKGTSIWGQSLFEVKTSVHLAAILSVGFGCRVHRSSGSAPKFRKVHRS